MPKEIIILERANEYIQALPEKERSKVLAHIKFMGEGDLLNVVTKQLSGPVRELIVKQHRIIYFSKKETLYFVSAFKKQSAKTPKIEIEYAKGIHKSI